MSHDRRLTHINDRLDELNSLLEAALMAAGNLTDKVERNGMCALVDVIRRKNVKARDELADAREGRHARKAEAAAVLAGDA